MSKTRRQCKKCPWRVEVDPHDIPNGYCPTKHAALEGTIAEPGDIPGALMGGELRMMACHEISTAGTAPLRRLAAPPDRTISLYVWPVRHDRSTATTTSTGNSTPISNPPPS